MTKCKDPVVEANRKMLKDRSNVGVEKYGTTLYEAGYSERQIVVHALEEALDLANYLQAQLMRIDRKLNEEKIALNCKLV